MTLFRSVLNKRRKADFIVGNIYIYFYQYFECSAFLLQGVTYSDGVGVFFWQCSIVLVSIISFLTVVLTALMIFIYPVPAITNSCFIKLVQHRPVIKIPGIPARLPPPGATGLRMAESADCMSIVCQFLSDIRARSTVYCKGTLADWTFTSMNTLFQWRTLQRSLGCKHTPSIWSLDHCINIKAHLL